MKMKNTALISCASALLKILFFSVFTSHVRATFEAIFSHREQRHVDGDARTPAPRLHIFPNLASRFYPAMYPVT